MSGRIRKLKRVEKQLDRRARSAAAKAAEVRKARKQMERELRTFDREVLEVVKGMVNEVEGAR